jgi:hypothetical protein
MKSFFSFVAVAAILASCSPLRAEPLVENATTQGTQFGTKPNQGVSFFGAPVTTQPSGAAQAAVSGPSLQQFVAAGHNGAGAVTITGAPLGAKVISVVNLSSPALASSSFEATLSVAGQIQQTSSSNLSGNTYLITVDAGNTAALANALRSALVSLGLIKGSN